MKALLGILVFAIFCLVGVGFITLVTMEEEPSSAFIAEGTLQGSSVVVSEVPYTLNFAQQETLVRLLNEGKKQTLHSLPSPSNSTVQAIMLYPFGNTLPLSLTPINADYGTFAVSSLKQDTYLTIENPLEMQKLLQNSYEKP